MARFRRRNRIMPEAMVRHRLEKQSCRSRKVEKDASQPINTPSTIFVVPAWRRPNFLSRIRAALLTCFVMLTCVSCMSKDGESPEIQDLAGKHILDQPVWNVEQLRTGTSTIKLRIRKRKKRRKIRRRVSAPCFGNSLMSLVEARREIATGKELIMNENGNYGKIKVVVIDGQPSNKALKVVGNLQLRIVDRKNSIPTEIGRKLSATPLISCGIVDQAQDSCNTGSGDLSKATELDMKFVKTGTSEGKANKIVCGSTDIQSPAGSSKVSKALTKDLSNHDNCGTGTSKGIEAGRDVPDKTATLITDLDRTDNEMRKLDTTKMDMKMTKIGASKSEIIKSSFDLTDIQNSTRLLNKEQAISINHDTCDTSKGIDAKIDVTEKLPTMTTNSNNTVTEVLQPENAPRKIPTNIQNSTGLLRKEQAIRKIDQDICDPSNQIKASTDVTDKLPTIMDQTVPKILQSGSTPRNVRSAIETNKDSSQRDSIKRSKSESECMKALAQTEKLQIPSKILIQDPSNQDICDTSNAVDANDNDVPHKLPIKMMVLDNKETDVAEKNMNIVKNTLSQEISKSSCEVMNSQNSTAPLSKEQAMQKVDHDTLNEIEVNKDVTSTEKSSAMMDSDTDSEVQQLGSKPRTVRSAIETNKDCSLRDSIKRSKSENECGKALVQGEKLQIPNKEPLEHDVHDTSNTTDTNNNDVAEKLSTDVMKSDSNHTVSEVLQLGSEPRKSQLAIEANKDSSQSESIKRSKYENECGKALMQGEKLEIPNMEHLGHHIHDTSSTVDTNNKDVAEKLSTTMTDSDHTDPDVLQLGSKPRKVLSAIETNKGSSKSDSIKRSKSENECSIALGQGKKLQIPNKVPLDHDMHDTSSTADINNKDVTEKFHSVMTNSDHTVSEVQQLGSKLRKVQSAIETNKDSTQTDSIIRSKSENECRKHLIQGELRNDVQMNNKDPADQNTTDSDMNISEKPVTYSVRDRIIPDSESLSPWSSGGSEERLSLSEFNDEAPVVLWKEPGVAGVTVLRCASEVKDVKIDSNDDCDVTSTPDEAHWEISEVEKMFKLHQERERGNRGKFAGQNLANSKGMRKAAFRKLKMLKISQTKEDRLEKKIEEKERKARKKLMQNIRIKFEKQENERVKIMESLRRRLSKAADKEQRNLVKRERVEEKRKIKIERSEMKLEMKYLEKELKIDKILNEEHQKVKDCEKDLTYMEMIDIKFMQTLGLLSTSESQTSQDENESSHSLNFVNSWALCGFNNDEQLALPGFASHMIFERQDFEKRLGSTIQTGIKIAIEKQKMRGKARKSFEELKSRMKMSRKSLEFDSVNSRKVVNVSIPSNTLTEAERLELCDILETFDEEQTQHLKGFEVFWNYSMAYHPHLPNVTYNRVPEFDIESAIKKIGLSIEEYGNRMANRMVLILKAAKAQSPTNEEERPSVGGKRSRWQRFKTGISSCFCYR